MKIQPSSCPYSRMEPEKCFHRNWEMTTCIYFFSYFLKKLVCSNGDRGMGLTGLPSSLVILLICELFRRRVSVENYSELLRKSIAADLVKAFQYAFFYCFSYAHWSISVSIHSLMILGEVMCSITAMNDCMWNKCHETPVTTETPYLQHLSTLRIYLL